MKFFDAELSLVRYYSDEPGKRYGEHIEKIKDRLPVVLYEISDSLYLHDATITEIELSPASGSMRIHFFGDDGSGGARNTRIDYTGVSMYRSIAHPEGHGAGPSGYGDMIYHEVDIADDAGFEHRMIFHNGIEVQVRFGGCELTIE